MTLAPDFAMTLVRFPLRDVVGFPGYVLHALLPPRADADREKVTRELQMGILMLERTKTFAQATGWIGVLVGAIIMLKNVDDPAAIGPGAAIMFKGSGFYATDYRSESYRKAAAAAEKKPEAKSNGSGKGEGKTAQSKSTAKATD